MRKNVYKTIWGKGREDGKGVGAAYFDAYPLPDSGDELVERRRQKEHQPLLHKHHKKFDKRSAVNSKLLHSYTSPHLVYDNRQTITSSNDNNNNNNTASSLSLTAGSTEAKCIATSSGAKFKSPRSTKFRPFSVLKTSKSHHGTFDETQSPGNRLTGDLNNNTNNGSLNNFLEASNSFTILSRAPSPLPTNTTKTSSPLIYSNPRVLLMKPKSKFDPSGSDVPKAPQGNHSTPSGNPALNISNQLFKQITKVEQDAEAQKMIETVDKTGEMTIRMIPGPIISTAPSILNQEPVHNPKWRGGERADDKMSNCSSTRSKATSQGKVPTVDKGSSGNGIVQKRSSLANTLFKKRDPSASYKDGGNGKPVSDAKTPLNEYESLDIQSTSTQDPKLIIQLIEIIKRPGQTLGLYIREGDGSTRSDGVFISRMAIGSSIERSGLLKVGDEILKVNGVDVTQMGLDDVVVIMSIPRRLLLEIKTNDSCKDNFSITLSDAPIPPTSQQPLYSSTLPSTNAIAPEEPTYLPRARLENLRNEVYSPNVGSALYLYDNNDVKISDQNIRQQYRVPGSHLKQGAGGQQQCLGFRISPPHATLTTAQVASAHFPSTSPTHKPAKVGREYQCETDGTPKVCHVEEGDYLYYNSQPLLKQGPKYQYPPAAYSDMIRSDTDYPPRESIIDERPPYPQRYESGKVAKLRERDDNRPYMYLVTEKMDDSNRKHLGDGVSYYYSYYPTCKTEMAANQHTNSRSNLASSYSRQPEGYYYYYHQQQPQPGKPFKESPPMVRSRQRGTNEPTYGIDAESRKTYSLDRPKRYGTKQHRPGAGSYHNEEDFVNQPNAANYKNEDDLARDEIAYYQQAPKSSYKTMPPFKSVSVDESSSTVPHAEDLKHERSALDDGQRKAQWRPGNKRDEDNWLYKDQSQRLAQYGTVYRPLGSYANRRRVYADTCTQTDPFSSVTKYHNGYFSDSYSEDRQDQSHRSLLLGPKLMSPEYSVASDTEATSIGRRSRLHRNNETKVYTNRQGTVTANLNQNDVQQFYRSPREEIVYIHSPRTDNEDPYASEEITEDAEAYYESPNQYATQRARKYSPNLYAYPPSNSFHSSLDSRYRSPQASAKSAGRKYVMKRSNTPGYGRFKMATSGTSSDILPFVKRDRMVPADMLWYESEQETDHRAPSQHYPQHHDYWMRRFDHMTSQSMAANEATNMTKLLLKKNLAERNHLTKYSLPMERIGENTMVQKPATKASQTLEESTKGLRSSLKSTSTTSTTSNTRRVHYLDNGRLVFRSTTCGDQGPKPTTAQVTLLPNLPTAATTTTYPKFAMESSSLKPSDISDLNKINTSESMTFSFNELDLSDYEPISPAHIVSEMPQSVGDVVSFVWPTVTGLLNVYVCACKDLGIPQHLSTTTLGGAREKPWLKSSSSSGLGGQTSASLSDSEAIYNYSEASTQHPKYHHLDDSYIATSNNYSAGGGSAKLAPNFPRKSSLYVIIEVDKCIKARTCAKPLIIDVTAVGQTAVTEGHYTMPIIWDEAFEIDLLGAKEIDLFFYHWKEVTEDAEQNLNGAASSSYFTVPKLCYQAFLDLPSLLVETSNMADKNSDEGVGNGRNHTKVRKLKVSLQPRGTLYVKLEFLDPTVVFLRTPKLPVDNSIFGVQIENLPHHKIEDEDTNKNEAEKRSSGDKNLVIEIFLILIPEIERRGGLNSVAIYNLCSCLREKRMVKVSMEKDMKATNLMEKGVPDLNILTDIVKDFLRELPEPLITNSLYQMLVEAYSVCNPSDPQGNESLLWSVIECLPKLNRVNLNYLVKHLKRVLAHSRFNKMDVDQLCAIFGPIILIPSTHIPETSRPDLEKAFSIFKYLLKIWKYDNDSILAKI